MTDESHLDKKYFINNTVYNCPFCNRRNVMYGLSSVCHFHWSEKKGCFSYIVECSHCKKRSMHLSYELISKQYKYMQRFVDKIDIDSKLFYSVPTSFFVMDERIPSVIRELITEAEGCLKMNYLTGASACTRKAIYELTVIEECKGEDYKSKIKSLKGKYSGADPRLFDTLSSIKDIASDNVHEQSWDKWDSNYLKFIIETIKIILQDVYVTPKEKEERYAAVSKMKSTLEKDKQAKKREKKTP